MKRWIIGIGLLLVAAYLAVLSVERHNLQLTARYVKGFTPIPELNTFVETSPRLDLGVKKLPHAVLLLHGWSASPQEFEVLITQLKAQGIPYYAPQLTGFGLDDLHLLRSIKTSDWLRDAIYSYDLLAAVAQEVSVVGHSNGGVLAIWIAQHRPVKHLILSSPNLAVSKEDKIYKTALRTPVIAQIIEFCLPVFAKPKRALNPRLKQADTASFRYPTLPIKSLVALWLLQDKADIDKANFQDLTVLYGKFDQDVDIPAVLAGFDRQRIPYNAIGYQQAAHNLLQSKDRFNVSDDILEVLEEE